MGNWSYWSNLQPTSLFHQVNIDGNAAPLALKKNAREEKSSQCASHVFFVGDFWCWRVLLVLYKRPTTDMSPWDPQKSVWISWWFSFPRWVRCLDVMISFLRCHDLQRFFYPLKGRDDSIVMSILNMTLVSSHQKKLKLAVVMKSFWIE